MTRTAQIKIGSRLVELRGVNHGDLPCDCWLNGNPAVIGWPQSEGGFAMVRDLTTGLGAEWSVEAARGIWNRDRRFKS